MDQLATLLGTLAAMLTSLSYIPQVRKAWPRDSTRDLSWKMLLALTGGLTLWVVYGLFKSDWVIAISNMVGALLSGSVLSFKIRDMYASRRRSKLHDCRRASAP